MWKSAETEAYKLPIMRFIVYRGDVRFAYRLRNHLILNVQITYRIVQKNLMLIRKSLLAILRVTIAIFNQTTRRRFLI